ncbi:MAG: hypothetical protein LBL31_04145 [Spirochaetaceae bacterium]|nr:hypothetical protein [Spirochaetaceae bacterium]
MAKRTMEARILRGGQEALRYGGAGAVAVFYFQHPSVPVFQKAAKERKTRNGPAALFREKTVPGTGRARQTAGGAGPKEGFFTFGAAFGTARNGVSKDSEHAPEDSEHAPIGPVPAAREGAGCFSPKGTRREHWRGMRTKRRGGAGDTRRPREAAGAGAAQSGKHGRIAGETAPKRR